MTFFEFSPVFLKADLLFSISREFKFYLLKLIGKAASEIENHYSTCKILWNVL